MSGLLLWVNGEPHELPARAMLPEVLAAHAPGAARGVAVAVNGAVVPRSQWAATPLQPDDRVEILVAAQGG